MAKQLTKDILQRIFSLTSESKTFLEQLQSLNAVMNHTLLNGRYLEIGSFQGLSLGMFSSLAFDHEFNDPMHITCVDSWEGGDEHKVSKTDFLGVEQCFDKISQICINEILPDDSKIEKLKSPSKHALSSISYRSEYYDLVLVDAGHKAKEVLSDLILAWDLLRTGGILIVDDYTWHPKHLDNHDSLINSPKLGVDSFLNCFSDEIILVSGQPLFQLYLKKESPSILAKKGIHFFALESKELPSIFTS
tara:strand:+ start:1402 stop:2145 length:744 start_codon:yes stop_codon:yes gene_type:complete